MPAISPFAARRERLLDHMQAHGGGVAVVFTAPEQTRNADAHYPYRADSYFYYLTGFDEPEAALVLRVDGQQRCASLFCRAKDEAREIWDGYRLGPQAAPLRLGLDEAFAYQELAKQLGTWLRNQDNIWWPFGVQPHGDALMLQSLTQLRQLLRLRVARPSAAHDLCAVLDNLRLVKDSSELDLMSEAARISARAHVRAMQTARPGLREYHLEAELLHEFRRHGSESAAYTSIVATGANACVLHYRAGDAELKAGDLCLIDAGCELHHYASDITRTFPVDGRFSTPQRELYELVLAAQEAALAQVRPGLRHLDAHIAAEGVLAQGMLDLGLLDRSHGDVDAVLQSKAHKTFFMHGTGHWLGLDVHDCGAYGEHGLPLDDKGELPSRVLQEGMVLTIEPGIYVRPGKGAPERYWNIGIRIEDDVVVGAQGCQLLTRDVPVQAQEIEALMRNRA